MVAIVFSLDDQGIGDGAVVAFVDINGVITNVDCNKILEIKDIELMTYSLFNFLF